MKLKPIGDRVLLEVLEEEQQEKTTESGLVLPDTARIGDPPARGKVLAVGEGAWDEDGEKRIPIDLVEGDVVLFGKYAGTSFSLEGKDHQILRESEVLAKVV